MSASEVAALRAENERLRAALSASSAAPSGSLSATAFSLSNEGVAALLGASGGGAGAASAASPGGSGGGGGGAGEPRRTEAEMKIWTGTWNMGAADPFLDADAATRSALLASFVPLDYDVYVLGIQEGISDAIFEAVEAHTGAFRLPLNARLYSAREVGGARVRSRRVGRAIKAQAFIEDAEDGLRPEPVVSTTDMLDRVWGRGDGAMLQPKFTGIAVFIGPGAAPYCRLLGVYKHSFGASEGSKGGVGVGLGLYNVTMAFINTHMASKKPEMRHAQYCELVDRLGSKLGGRGFGLNESFHHVVWMGDLNVQCKGLSAADAVSLVRQGKHMQMLLHHDELLIEKDKDAVFFEYEEPIMGPRFFPTYKKMPGRGPVDVRDADWVSKVYITAYKEPFYKGGRVMERIPSWTDRIQYHSLPDKWGELLPECVDKGRDARDQARGAPPIHNYHAVNDALDSSDHSPVFATFNLQIVVDEVDEAVTGREAEVAALQATMGYAQAERPAEEGGDGTGAGAAAGGISAPEVKTRALAVGHVIDNVDFSELHPSLRPLQVDITVYGLVVDHRGGTAVPRALTVVFPLPFEDSDEIPDRSKVVREVHFPFFGRQQESIGLRTRSIVSRANRLDSLHLLVKVSLDDGVKAQCVLCMRDGGFVGAGTHMNTFKLPLTSNGLPVKVDGRVSTVTFTLEMNAFERGGVQASAQPPVTVRPHQTQGQRAAPPAGSAAEAELAASQAQAQQQAMMAAQAQQQQAQQQQQLLLAQQQVQDQQRQQQAQIAAQRSLAQPPAAPPVAARPPPPSAGASARPLPAGAGSEAAEGSPASAATPLRAVPQPPTGAPRPAVTLAPRPPPPAGLVLPASGAAQAALPAGLLSPAGGGGAGASGTADAAARQRLVIAQTRARAQAALQSTGGGAAAE